ncbi:uncharacterized protein LOC125315463 [Rhodamnia argentea]|uniref:Uncharacterized protein LOC125315463 n=1 Tax=Rhodamnia argentea TaxID=178133 RepID=A0ABM3HIZ0_9MYRT|nr:uncharacterized protein LOC125315463 [Rhodamnia argentea]
MEGRGKTAIVEDGSSVRKQGRPENDDRGRLEGSKIDKLKRENIAELYSKLRSMVPGVCPKAPMAETLQEAVLYIRSLEEEMARLEKLKMSSGQLTTTSTSISVHSSNSNLACFAITSPIRRNLVTDVINVFDEHRAEIITSHIVAHEGRMRMTVTAAVNDVDDRAVEKIKQDILTVESKRRVSIS